VFLSNTGLFRHFSSSAKPFESKRMYSNTILDVTMGAPSGEGRWRVAGRRI
jgi:hypothetical protein